MEVKPGYKRTEVGVIPEDWEVGCLGGKTKKVGSGITPTGGERIYKTEGHPFLRSQNVGWGHLLMEDIAYIDDEIHDTFPATEIEADDVFLNITGASIGRSAVADSRVVGGNVNQHVCIIRTNREQLHPRFLNYFLLSNAGQRQIDSFQAGGNRQGLNFSQIRSFQLPIPTPPEQRAIATALSDVDALIASLDKLIAKKRDIKQGSMQQLLTGKKRLPGFEVKPGYKQTEAGVIPEDWTEATPSLLAGTIKERFDDGDWIEAEYLTESGIRLLQTGNIGIGIFVDKETKKYISEDSFRLLRCKEVYAGDLLICRLADPAGRTCIVPQLEDAKAITAVDVTIFRPLEEVADKRYLLQYFCTRSWFTSVNELCGGSTRTRISRGLLATIPIPLPPTRDEQTAIAAVLSDMDVDIAVLEARRDKTHTIKQGMMQELLTGRIRLT